MSDPKTADKVDGASAPEKSDDVKSKEEKFVLTVPHQGFVYLADDSYDVAANVPSDEAKAAFRRVLNNGEHVDGDENFKADFQLLSLHRGVNPFHVAAAVANMKYLEKVPIAAMETIRVDERKRTVVDFAVRGDHVDVLRYLHRVLSTETFAEKNTGGYNPCHVAAHAGSLNALKFLVEEAGVDVNATASDGEPVITMAIRFQRVEVVRYLVSQKHQPVNLDIRNKVVTGVDNRVVGHQTPWTIACKQGDEKDKVLEIVKVLFAAGAHKESLIESKEYGGEIKLARVTPDDAAEKDTKRLFVKIRHFPVMPGAAFGSDDKFKKAVVNATVNNNINSSSSISNNKVGGKKSKNAAAAAAAATAPVVATTAAEDDAAVDERASAAAGAAAAASPYSPEIDASRLYYLQSGMRRDRYNGTLHQAARGHVEVVKFLIEEAGFAHDKDVLLGPFTPLLEAVVECSDGNPSMVKYLLETAKVDVNKCSSKGMPAVYAAARSGKADCLRVLIDNGCNQNLIYSQAAPLFAAVEQGQLACVEMMLASGRVDATTTFYSRTVLQCAREKQNAQMVALLERYNVA